MEYLRRRNKYHHCKIIIFISGILFLLELHLRSLREKEEKNLGKVSEAVSFDDVSLESQQDPKLISMLRKEVIEPPSGLRRSLIMFWMDDMSQFKQGKYLFHYFKPKKNGTFIEAGAFTGEDMSNTLTLERKLGWKGLLIEPNPQSYQALQLKNRKAHLAQCCLSLTPTSSQLDLSLNDQFSRIIQRPKKKANETKPITKGPKFVTVNCYPLYSLMVAANLTTVDLLSLDVEGVEMKVLKTIPWKDVDIKSILVEANHVPEGKEFLIRFLEQRNYKIQKSLGFDLFFVKNE